MPSPSQHRSRTRKLWLVLVVLGVAGVIGLTVGRKRAEKPDQGRASWEGASGPRPIPVRVIAAQKENLVVRLKTIGTVTPLNTVTVRSRVDGQLQRVVFEEGQKVEKGQLLAEIDPAPYAIRLAQSEGQRRQSVAQIESARRDLERLAKLYASKLVTAQEYELQQTLVAEREGALASIIAEVENAKLQLDYAKIAAPISGRLGLRQIDAGNLIRANDANGLVVITQTQPISVLFTVPEVELQKVLDPLRAGEPMKVEAWDRNEQNLLATGVLKTIDNQIDVQTGTLRLKAEFLNGDERLFPNQFVNVRLPVQTIANAVAIPGAAVQHGSRGTYVYVIKDQKAVVRDVTLGPADGTRQSIAKGLVPGEMVVLEGLDRLRDGSKVISMDATSTPPAPGAKAGP